jgi:MFS family permease
MPFNVYLGRRGTIFATCVISALTVVWQAVTNSWWHLFIARFALWLGIGLKSATVPIWAAESAPPAIRGALVMQWQLWTAFGIMWGYAADLALFKVRDPPGGNITGLNWRLMLASTLLPAAAVCALVFACPELPRRYTNHGRHEDAYRALMRLRYCCVQAARNVFYMHTLLEAEADMKRMGRSKLLDLVTVPRNRRALVASEIVMFKQQVGSSSRTGLPLPCLLHFSQRCWKGHYPLRPLLDPLALPPFMLLTIADPGLLLSR